MTKRVAVRNTGRRISKQSRIDLTEEQRIEIKSAFDVFDTDKNGFIDKKEFQVCIKAMGFDITKSEANEIMRERGINNKLDYPAFQEILGEKMQQRNPLEEIKKAFQLFKADEEPNITIDDLRKIAKEMDNGLTEEDLEAMIREFDVDGDGQISMAEFISIMDPSQSI